MVVCSDATLLRYLKVNTCIPNFPVIHVVVKISKMATEALRVDSQQESYEALSREAETLKQKLIEERAKLNDVDCKYSHKCDHIDTVGAHTAFDCDGSRIVSHTLIF